MNGLTFFSHPLLRGTLDLMLGLVLILGGLFVGTGARDLPRPDRKAPDGMVHIPAGTYTPLYQRPTDTTSTPVAPFFLDTHPVTNAEYLAFVEDQPQWRRSQIKRLFADENYLQHWRGDLDFGPDALGNRPVVNVSWFAASAFAQWSGKRLPTTAEWERAARASERAPDGTGDPAFRQRILQWYSQRTPEVLPPVGSTFENHWGARDMHGLIWEWVLDFNTGFVTGESRNNADLDRTLFCGSGSVGASDFNDYAAFIRFAFRSGLQADYTVPHLGFRCARDI